MLPIFHLQLFSAIPYIELLRGEKVEKPFVQHFFCSFILKYINDPLVKYEENNLTFLKRVPKDNLVICNINKNINKSHISLIFL